MENNSAKMANRKALPKFILMVVVGAAVGAVLGFLSVRYGLDGLAAPMKAAGAVFGSRVAPWLLAAMAVLVPVTALPFYRKAKGLLAGWDGEDEAVSDAAEEKLSTATWIVSGAVIISYFLIAAAYSGGFAAFEDKTNAWLVLVGSCDEAEKAMIGKCAFKAFSAASSACNALALVFTISALIFGTGFLPVLAVCTVWLVSQCVYCREGMKLGRAGNKISE